MTFNLRADEGRFLNKYWMNVMHFVVWGCLVYNPNRRMKHLISRIFSRFTSYLADTEKIKDSFTSYVGCNNNIILIPRIASSNSFGCCSSDWLGVLNQIFRGGFFVRKARWIIHLKNDKKKKKEEQTVKIEDIKERKIKQIID